MASSNFTTDIISPDILEKPISTPVKMVTKRRNPILATDFERKRIPRITIRTHSRKYSSRGIFDRPEIFDSSFDSREDVLDTSRSQLPETFRGRTIPIGTCRDPGLLDCSFPRIHELPANHVTLNHRFYLLKLENPVTYSNFIDDDLKVSKSKSESHIEPPLRYRTESSDHSDIKRHRDREEDEIRRSRDYDRSSFSSRDSRSRSDHRRSERRTSHERTSRTSKTKFLDARPNPAKFLDRLDSSGLSDSRHKSKSNKIPSRWVHDLYEDS